LGVTFDESNLSHKTRKLNHLAEATQRGSSKKMKKNDVSLDVHLVHAYLKQQLTTSNNDIKALPEKMLRAGVAFFIQLVGCGRPQDPFCFLDGGEIFPKGCTNWNDVPVGQDVAYRLYKTKDVELSKCNNEATETRTRNKVDDPYGDLSSIVNVTRVASTDRHPDYFVWIHELKRRLQPIDSHVHTVEIDLRDGKGRQMLKLPRIMQSLTTAKTRSNEILSSTVNARVNDILELSGAVDKNRKHKCQHIRHSIVTFVLAYANAHNIANQPTGPVNQMLLRSRHSRDTAETSYNIILNPASAQRIEELPNNLSYTDLLFWV
jgi:hypothetical protein